jgi:formiminotetrahydrofolate cyclodeaminase
MLPQGTHPTGPRTVYTPPNYVPAPKDQRINDAVAEAKRAKEKLEAAAKQVQDRLNEDNNLRGELQAQIDENQRLQDQINAGMNTPKHTEKAPTQTDAEKAAAAAVDPLVSWGQQLQQ